MVKYNIYKSIQNQGLYAGVPTLTINFEHAVYDDTTDILVSRIQQELRNDHNPSGLFMHPKTNQYTHLVFRGNAMSNQETIVEILQLLEKTNHPKYITIETNGATALSDNFRRFLIGRTKEWSDGIKETLDLTWAVSFNEKTNNKFISDFQDIGTMGYIKFDATMGWTAIEFESCILKSQHNIQWSIWVESHLLTTDIMEETFNRGYNLSILGS